MDALPPDPSSSPPDAAAQESAHVSLGAPAAGRVAWVDAGRAAPSHIIIVCYLQVMAASRRIGGHGAAGQLEQPVDHAGRGFERGAAGQRGCDVLVLVSRVVQAALAARRHRNAHRRLAQHVEILSGLLRELELAELIWREATRRPLEQLSGALR